MASQWWFANEKMLDNHSALRSTASAGSKDYAFKDAQKLTIAVEEVFVLEKKDAVSDNDLIICTKHQRGDRPEVDKVHFFQQNVKAPSYEGAFFHPVVFATRDFREEDTLITIELKVYDQDGLSKKESGEIEAGIGSAATASAIAFPAFAPYAGLAAGVGSALVELVNKLDAHDRILKGRIQLNVNKPSEEGYDLLQPGFLVCFEMDVNAASLVLGNDRRVYRLEGTKAIPYVDMSYAVLRVRRDFLPTPDYAIDEKMATLLTQLDFGKGKPGTASLNFLRETLESYTNFTRLQRYTELAAKPAPTDDEKALLAELKGDPKIQPYLPAGHG